MSGGHALRDFDEPKEGFTDISDWPRVVKLNGHAGSGFEFHNFGRRHARGKIRRDWLIEGLLPRRGVGILSGQSGVGKTHIVLDLIASIALGEPFAGMAVERVCGAVLFAAEGQDDAVPRWDVIEQAKVVPYMERHNLPAGTYIPANWFDDVPRLTAPDAFEQYRARLIAVAQRDRDEIGIAYGGLGLVAIDTFTAAVDLSDDQTNSAGTNQLIFTRLHQLAHDLDCFVLVVDHMGKDMTRGTRGSTAKEASADVVLAVTGMVAEDGSVSNTAMSVRKLRGGAAGKRVMFSLAPVRMPLDEDGRRQDGVVVKWDVASSKMRDGRGVASQNKRHRLLLSAFDKALEQAEPRDWQMVHLGHNLNFKAVDSALVRTVYKLSAPPTDSDGKARNDYIAKSYNRAMLDACGHFVLGSKTLSDGRVMVWRTDYKHADSSEVSA